LRGKLQLAEQHSKNSQSIVQLSLNEIRTLQKMIDMTYLQGLSGSSVLPSLQHEMNPSMGTRSGGNNANPPSNYVCHKCGIPGHYVHDCPNVIGRGPPPENYLCHKCKIQGHWIQDCPLGNQPDYSKAPPPGYCCHRCGIPGHWIKNCPTNTNVETTDNSQRDAPNYGQREQKISQQLSNSQQVDVLNNTGEYLENDTKDTDINAPLTVTQVSSGTTEIEKPTE